MAKKSLLLKAEWILLCIIVLAILILLFSGILLIGPKTYRFDGKILCQMDCRPEESFCIKRFHKEAEEREKARAKRIYENIQSSPFQINGLLKFAVCKLLRNKDICFHYDSWNIQCPMCNNGAAICQNPGANGRYIINFIQASPGMWDIADIWSDAYICNNIWHKDSIKQVYCICGYPFGTDWLVKKL